MDNRKYKRIFTIVIDSVGVGAMEDAEKYGDKGTDTLGHISQNVPELQIPNLQKLGMDVAAKQIKDAVSDFQKGNLRLSLALTTVKEQMKEA